MKKEEFEVIRKIIIKSNNFTKKEIEQLDKTNSWEILVKEFYDKCSEDVTIVELFKQIKQIKEILNFDIKQEYLSLQAVTDTKTGAVKEELVFDAAKYALAQYIYDNIKEILERLYSKLTRIEKEVLTIKIKEEIQRIKNLIAEKQAIAQKHKEALEKQKLAELYRKKERERLKKLEEKFKLALKEKARKLKVYQEFVSRRKGFGYISEDLSQGQ